ncbi:MAG: bifunctional (p)ppGpp synthetase/guanosine-3',5'-bis(diphosphate) 3'-pyrophosphohydrolase [Clostridia bacterium]|nr:bifunctional (p)ppGpp synthetase/guanosine-3',5'-bis(diphosphate) 3'-pyrophosphohydrolase [Clostridia bacterium]
MNEVWDRDYNELLTCLKEQGGKYDLDLIKKAFYYCVQSHEGQKRWTNEDYYIHPFNVAKIIISLGMDSQSVAAALLHDVVEDTKASVDDIKKMFGDDVALLVDGVTRIGMLNNIVSKEEERAESLRKMLIAMGKDIRVIIIKLADRLHNMRTIDAVPKAKQREKSLETLEIYAPIAHRLGIRPVKEELEDISIKHLDPVAYDEIESLLKVQKPQRDIIMKELKERTEERVRKEMPNTHMTFQSRVKSVYGIYRKMYLQGRDFDEIYDVYAIRIITDTVSDCYNVLGIMHDLFRPIPNRFKDYISTPKPNMYQSLHTTVISREGLPFEIQIRTFEMHHTAEYGIAAHWKYKENISRNDEKMEKRLAWIRQILEDNESVEDATDLVRSIKIDLSEEDVFAVTPRGDIINLPVGSTVVDFAFAIHSAVGIKMIGAKADGKIVPINHQIKTGEVIEILTSNGAGRGPSRDWLNIAVTSSAKSKIKQWFKKEKRAENIETGKSEIDREMRRENMHFENEEEMEALLDESVKRYHFNDIEEFYAAIGYGGILLSKIMPRLREDYQKMHSDDKLHTFEDIKAKQTGASSEGVVVEGIDNCLIKLSKCCAPLPGDDIIGFITRGHGVSIHKRDCNNVPRDISLAEDPGRWIPAHWINKEGSGFASTIQIAAIDREGLLSDVMNVAYNMRLAVHSLNARNIKGGNSIIVLTINAESVEHLKNIISRFEKIDGVINVERFLQ